MTPWSNSIYEWYIHGWGIRRHPPSQRRVSPGIFSTDSVVVAAWKNSPKKSQSVFGLVFGSWLVPEKKLFWWNLNVDTKRFISQELMAPRIRILKSLSELEGAFVKDIPWNGIWNVSQRPVSLRYQENYVSRQIEFCDHYHVDIKYVLISSYGPTMPIFRLCETCGSDGCLLPIHRFAAAKTRGKFGTVRGDRTRAGHCWKRRVVRRCVTSPMWDDGERIDG